MTPFNETIREIATNAVNSFPDVESVATEYEIVEAAILSAFDEFAKREPSIPVIDEGVDAFVLQMENDECTTELAMRYSFRAMLAQAAKEMKDELQSRG